jgi:hypothetical protein
MATNEHQDWVDRALAQSAWEPSAHFTNRVIVSAMATLPVSAPRLGFWERVRISIAGVRDSLLARLEGMVWVMTQYRELLWR